MSYSISIFDAEVQVKHAQGLDLDAFEHPALDADLQARFMDRLAQYEYVLERESAQCKEFVRHVDSCPIQVAVFKTQISFSVPFWDGCEDAIAEAVQDASELVETAAWAIYDPQIDTWLE